MATPTVRGSGNYAEYLAFMALVRDAYPFTDADQHLTALSWVCNSRVISSLDWDEFNSLVDLAQSDGWIDQQGWDIEAVYFVAVGYDELSQASPTWGIDLCSTHSQVQG